MTPDTDLLRDLQSSGVRMFLCGSIDSIILNRYGASRTLSDESPPPVVTEIAYAMKSCVIVFDARRRETNTALRSKSSKMFSLTKLSAFMYKSNKALHKPASRSVLKTASDVPPMCAQNSAIRTEMTLSESESRIVVRIISRRFSSREPGRRLSI
ncbi:family transcriptional regulator, putative [Babesia ovata]|uniref:Family transcriptional regulator, putative n=1 Tax=Babesia ovata TaxID=189622 RepID=A0A2H6KJC5_9APIC|nr:family transcriptional regulator, putative [Babesia ovata]GBE63080.1 family transcriptional regulator, putative [Babesia ovata]